MCLRYKRSLCWVCVQVLIQRAWSPQLHCSSPCQHPQDCAVRAQTLFLISAGPPFLGCQGHITKWLWLQWSWWDGRVAGGFGDDPTCGTGDFPDSAYTLWCWTVGTLRAPSSLWPAFHASCTKRNATIQFHTNLYFMLPHSCLNAIQTKQRNGNNPPKYNSSNIKVQQANSCCGSGQLLVTWKIRVLLLPWTKPSLQV